MTKLIYLYNLKQERIFLSLKIVAFIALLAASSTLDAQEWKKYVTPPEDIDAVKEARKENLSFIERFLFAPDSLKVYKNVKTLPLPVITSSIETGFVYGVNLQSYWHFNRDLRNTTSSARFTVANTTNQQFFLRSFWNLSMDQDQWRVAGEANYNRFPMKYFGVGNNFNDEKVITEFIDQDYMIVKTDLMRRVSEKIFVGLDMRYTGLFDVNIMKDETEEYSGKTENYLFDEVLGNDGYNVFGIGPKFVRDTRDQTTMPYSGSLLELYSLFYGGTYKFTKVSIDYRKYIDLRWDNHYLAIMGTANLNYGDVPYKELPGIGQNLSDNLSVGRGYYSGRYIDNNLYYTQAEYRYPLFRSIRGVAFVGAGDVFDSADDIAISKMKVSYGVGLRVPFDKASRVYLRIDYAMSPHEKPGFYLNVGEAF